MEDINALGHDYTVTYEWAADGSSCKATAVCKRDGSHIISENGTITDSVLIAPTFLKMGTTRYTANFTNEVFNTQTKDIEDIERLFMYGDVNSDQVVDMKDVLMLRKILANYEDVDMTVYNAKAADAATDGKVDMKDVLAIRKYIAKQIDFLGPGTI